MEGGQAQYSAGNVFFCLLRKHIDIRKNTGSVIFYTVGGLFFFFLKYTHTHRHSIIVMHEVYYIYILAQTEL